jgi:hypothetical protein
MVGSCTHGSFSRVNVRKRARDYQEGKRRWTNEKKGEEEPIRE